MNKCTGGFFKLTIKITNVNPDDLLDIFKIEEAGFVPEQAATKEAIAERIEHITDTFFVARNDDNKVVGFINGPVVNQRYLTDDLFIKTTVNPANGGFQSILSLAVSAKYQHQGISGQLLKAMEENALSNKRQAVTLTCLRELIGFYERHGYKNEGMALSEHGGAEWFNMVKVI